MSIAISEDQLSDATFQLLASSTLRRYLRIAREYAGKAELERQLESEPGFADAALKHALRLYETVRGAEQRPREEAEIALLLVALSDARAPIYALLLLLSEDSSPGLGWLRLLADRLLKAGPLPEEDFRLEPFFVFLGSPPAWREGKEYEPGVDRELMQGSHQTPRAA